MKLVAGSGGAPRLNQNGEMELPTADSCAMDSDEEEENDEFDSVFMYLHFQLALMIGTQNSLSIEILLVFISQVDFKEGSRKKNLLNKLKNMGGGGGGGGGQTGSLISGGQGGYGSDMETNLLNEKVFHEL